MSNYTEKMVKALTAQGSWDYDTAEAFASDNNLSTRSVISKGKSRGLDYTPKPKAAAPESVAVPETYPAAAAAAAPAG